MSDFNPSGADITEAILRSYSGSKSVDISGLIVEFEFIQSMEAQNWIGSLTIQDSTGLLENFPLRAEEYIDLTVVSYDLGTEVKLKTRVYKISDAIPTESNNGVLFVMHIVSDITFQASTRRITKAYEGKMDEIVKEVFDTYFSRLGNGRRTDADLRSRSRTEMPYETQKYSIISDSDRFFYIQENTAGKSQVIIPYLAPAQAMTFLCARSYAGISCPSQTFRFFETLDAYYYATDEFFIASNSAGRSVKTLFYCLHYQAVD